MIDIDHAKEAEQLGPEPSRAILASHLLDLEEKQRKRFTGPGRAARVSAGCAVVDELLGGNGVERGVVLGISGEGTEGRLVSGF